TNRGSLPPPSQPLLGSGGRGSGGVIYFTRHLDLVVCFEDLQLNLQRHVEQLLHRIDVRLRVDINSAHRLIEHIRMRLSEPDQLGFGVDVLVEELLSQLLGCSFAGHLGAVVVPEHGLAFGDLSLKLLLQARQPLVLLVALEVGSSLVLLCLAEDLVLDLQASIQEGEVLLAILAPIRPDLGVEQNFVGGLTPKLTVPAADQLFDDLLDIHLLDFEKHGLVLGAAGTEKLRSPTRLLRASFPQGIVALSAGGLTNPDLDDRILFVARLDLQLPTLYEQISKVRDTLSRGLRHSSILPANVAEDSKKGHPKVSLPVPFTFCL